MRKHSSRVYIYIALISLLLQKLWQSKSCLASGLHPWPRRFTAINSEVTNYNCNLLFLLPHRKIRNEDATIYHIQLSIAIFCMLVVFAAGINQVQMYEGCIVVSVLIHYFTLVAVMWMGAEALLTFQKLVIVFIDITKRFIVILSLVCWCKFLHCHFVYFL